jgi:hypothetical protein
LAIADISGWRVASAVGSDRDRHAVDTQNRLQAFLWVISLDLFALIRLRSAAGEFAMVSARFRYDAVQHRDGQLRRASPLQKPLGSRFFRVNPGKISTSPQARQE